MGVDSAPPERDRPDTDAGARASLARLAALPGVRRVGLALAEGGGRRLLFTADDRLGGADPTQGPGDWCHIDAYDDVPLNHAVRTGSPVHLHVHVVPPELSAASHARHFVDDALASWDVSEDARDIAAVCLSELVTNALIHTDGGCVVRVSLDQAVLTVAVRDRGGVEVGPHPTASQEAADPLAVHGRGLAVVKALTSRWGSDLSSTGTTVWFVLDL